MEAAGKMTKHLRLHGNVCFTDPKPVALKEFVHAFQIRDQPARQRVSHPSLPDIEIISAVPYLAPEGTEITAVRIWRSGNAPDEASYAFGAYERNVYSVLEDTPQLGEASAASREFAGLHAEV